MKKTVFISLLIAISMCIFIIEAQLPPITPFPGVKAGLSNVIVLITLILLGKSDAIKVLLLKIILSSVILGQGLTIIYSLAGGLSAFLVMAIFQKPLKDYIWVLSVLGACAHNAGQLITAAFLMNTSIVFSYFPVLLISGIITGALTGLISQAVILKSKYIRNLFLSLRNDN